MEDECNLTKEDIKRLKDGLKEMENQPRIPNEDLVPKEKDYATIVWIADECAEVSCACGRRVIIDIYPESENKCEDCGRKYKLVQYVEEIK